jgi:hypothetical protein
MKEVASASSDRETLAWATENPALMELPAPIPMSVEYA